MYIIYKKYFAKLFLIIFFVSGVSLVKNYGISFDEESNRLYGLVNGNYILKTFLSEKKYNDIFSKVTTEKFSEKIKIKQPTPLHEFPDRAYGVIFELPVTALEILLNFSTFHDSFTFRHVMTFFFYTISLLFFYLLLNKLFKNKILSFVGITFLITYPRIFAHSFYNSKDIVFMSLFIMTAYFSYSYLLKRKLKNFLLLCFFSACSINLRTIGFVLPLMVYLNILFESYNLRNFKNKDIYLIPLFIIIFLYLIWPFLWENPVSNFYYVLTWFKNIPITIDVFYLGQDINAKNVPWHYLFVWIAVTTPSYLLFSFLLGITIFFINIIKRKDGKKFFFSIFFFLFFLPIFLTVVLNIAIYDGWRHFFFIAPFIIIFSIIFIEKLIKNIHTKVAKLTLLALIIFFFKNVYDLYSLHPHQYLYFNKEIIKNPLEKFDKDYWGLSNKIVLDKFIDKVEDDKVIYGFHGSMLPLSIKFMDKFNNKKFIHFDDVSPPLDYIKPDEKDGPFYIFANNRYHPRYDIYQKYGETIYEFKIDGIIINGVYKFNSIEEFNILKEKFKFLK